MSVLRQYHYELGRIITEHDGTIEHFAGDGLMVLFNTPMPVENHELRAVHMAIAMRDALTLLSAIWRKRGHSLGFGVGIAGGYATIGTIGFEQRLDYGAIGPATNLAARLCGEAKDRQIIIAPRVLAKIEGQVEVGALGELSLKGSPPHACLQRVGNPSGRSGTNRSHNYRWHDLRRKSGRNCDLVLMTCLWAELIAIAHSRL
jgi:class 3 adenylate cyclase